MSKFVIRFFIFSLPVVLPSLFFYGTGYYIGETIPLQTVVSEQQNSNRVIVFLPEWRQLDYIHYKLLGTQASNPDILVFGSSRMLYFSDYFLVNGTLYNASVAGASIDFQLAMLEQLIESDTIPDVVIIGIDLVTYNSTRPVLDPGRTNSVSLNSHSSYFNNSFRRVIMSWFSGEMPDLMQQSRSDGTIFWGTVAINDRVGLLLDGSTYLPEVDPARVAANFARVEQEYLNAATHFTRGTDISSENIAMLENFLSLAQENDIKVIGLTQPFHPDFEERMRDNPDFTYRELARDAISALFADTNFPLYHFPDIESYGGSADDFLDDWHYNQLAALRIFHIIATESQDILGNYVDLEQLQADIETATNPYAVYQEDLIP